ncbi:MAG TPA: hypothetical protein VK081_00880, partial [Planctomycetota bacterium]|nr:hypothetical protein [Planctomycetota bacterium]
MHLTLRAAGPVQEGPDQRLAHVLPPAPRREQGQDERRVGRAAEDHLGERGDESVPADGGRSAPRCGDAAEIGQVDIPSVHRLPRVVARGRHEGERDG